MSKSYDGSGLRMMSGTPGTPGIDTLQERLEETDSEHPSSDTDSMGEEEPLLQHRSSSHPKKTRHISINNGAASGAEGASQSLSYSTTIPIPVTRSHGVTRPGSGPPIQLHPTGKTKSGRGRKVLPKGAVPAPRWRRQRPVREVAAWGSDLEEVMSLDKSRRLSGYCVAQEFDHENVLKALRPICSIVTPLNAEVIHVAKRNWIGDGDAFIFSSFGAIVFWNVDVEQEQALVSVLTDLCDEETLLNEIEEDDYFYQYSFDEDAAKCYITPQSFILAQTDKRQDILHRLAVSYGLATSVKLNSFERAIEKTVSETQRIPEELALEGRIRMSKDEVSRKIGELYMLKSSVNLCFNILDAPDYFWDFDDLEAIYSKCRKMLDIDNRVDVVNTRLDVLDKLLEILRSEKSEQHGTRLEWIIIWLIVAETVLGALDIIVNYYRH